MSERKGPPAKRGFAAMDGAKQRDIAQRGGRSVPADKRSFSQSRELAVAAGRKGGRSVPGGKRSFAVNPDLAAEAGRRGRDRSTSNETSGPAPDASERGRP
jgi:general stress protein YciG